MERLSISEVTTPTAAEISWTSRKWVESKVWSLARNKVAGTRKRHIKSVTTSRKAVCTLQMSLDGMDVKWTASTTLKYFIEYLLIFHSTRKMSRVAALWTYFKCSFLCIYCEQPPQRRFIEQSISGKRSLLVYYLALNNRLLTQNWINFRERFNYRFLSFLHKRLRAPLCRSVIDLIALLEA